MADSVPQNYANHVRWGPLFHFFALPVVLLTLIVTIVHLVHRPNWFSGWLVIFSVAIVILTVKARFYALRVQDRLIRLEGRERLASLLAEPLRSRVGELSEGQLVGLRFACDAEVPGLVQDAVERSCLSPTSRSRSRSGERITSGYRATSSPDMNSVGIGVVQHRGQLFVVEDFAQAK